MEDLTADLRFLLQTQAQKPVNQLSTHEMNFLESLREMKDPAVLHTIPSLLEDLNLGRANIKPRTVLAWVYQLIGRLPEELIPTLCTLDNKTLGPRCDKHIVWYQCADRVASPVFISSPENYSSDEAYVYVDTRNFGGFPTNHLKQLREEGIRKVQIIRYDGSSYESLTEEFTDLSSLHQRDSRSMEIEPDTDNIKILILIGIFITMLLVGHKIIR